MGEDKPVSGVDDTEAPAIALDGTLPVSDAEAAAAGDRARAVAAGTEVLPVIDRTAYSVAGELARGGLGRILRARDRRLDRTVALKETLHPGPDLAARFVREALVTARLQHPAIVPVYEAGRWPSGEPFFAMKLVSGRPLDAVIRGAATVEARLALLPNAIAVAEALAYAHQERIIHRDLKPQNVLVGSFGETVVIDWGLAKDLGDAGAAEVDAGPYRAAVTPGETVAGAVMGTPAFMPPEQARGEAVDERADVYALGAMLHHLLAGEPPYTGASSQEILDAVIREPPVPLAQHQPEVPADLAAIVAKAMAREPGDRYPTAAEMAEELRRFQTGQLVGAHRYTTWALLRRWIRRHRGAVSVAAAALAVIAVVSVVAVWRVVRERDRAEAGEADAKLGRADAEKATAEARERLSRQYEEQGRRELLDGNPSRALVYLSESYQLGDRPSLRFLLAQALPFLDVRTTRILKAGGWVRAARYTPDGTRVLTIAAPERDPMSELADQAAVWDAASGRKLLAFTGTTGELKDVVPSPDGTRALVSRLVDDHIDHPGGGHQPHWNTEVAIYAIDTGARVRALSAPGFLHLAAWADGGRRVVAATDEAGAVVWDAATGAELARIAADLVSVSADGAHLFVRDGADARVLAADSLRVESAWKDDTRTRFAVFAGDDIFLPAGREIHRWTRFGQRWGSLVGAGVHLSAAAERLAAATAERELSIWSKYLVSVEPEIRVTAHAEPLTDVLLEPEGGFVATASQDGTAAIWEVESGRLLARLEGHREWIENLALAPDGMHLLTASRDGTVRIWTVPRRVPFVDAGPDIMNHVAAHRFAPDGKSIAVAPGDASTAIWDTATGRKRVDLQGQTAVPAALAWSPDSGRVLTASNPAGEPLSRGDGSARVFDAGSGRLLSTLDGLAGSVEHASWGARGPVLVTRNRKGELQVVRPLDGTRVAVAGHLGAVADDGERLLIARDGKSLIVDVGGTERMLAGAGAEVHGGRFSPDGSRVLVAGPVSGAVFDVASGRKLADVSERRSGQAVFSPDGARVAVPGRNGARIYDAASGRLVLTLEGHIDSVVQVGYSADGARLATASHDDTVKLWDAANGALLATLGKHEHWVLDAVFSPDGNRLAAEVARRSLVRLWDIRLEMRTPAEVEALVRCRVPLRLVEGVPLPAELDPSACPPDDR